MPYNNSNNDIAVGQMVYQKNVTKLFTPSLFWRTMGTPEAKFTSLGGGLQQGPLCQAAKFRPPFRQSLYEISAADKVRRFR